MKWKKDQIYGELRRLPREVELARKTGIGHVTFRSVNAPGKKS